jgi:hypothetical protein
MIEIFILTIIFSFLINFIVISFLNPLSLSNKIIIIFITSLVIAYLINKNSDKINIIENKFVKYSIILFLLYCCYIIFNYIYGYGIKSSKSFIMILFVGFFLFIVFNFYMYNKALRNIK